MKTLLILINLYFCVFSLSAQTIDSLAILRQVDSLIQLNRTYVKQKNFDEALKAVKTAINKAENTFGKKHVSLARCLFNHGRTLTFMGNHDEESETLYLEAKTIWENTDGQESSEYSACLNNLAILYKKPGQYNKAESLYLESLRIKEKVTGKEHFEYANSLYNLAILYSDMGLNSKAEMIYIEAKTIWENIDSKECWEYVDCLKNLAILYGKMLKYETAEMFFLDAMEIEAKVNGKEHPEYAGILYNLADLYNSMGRFTSAKSLLLNALTINEKAFGKEHIKYAFCLSRLATSYRRLEQYELAEPLLLEINTILSKLLGKDHLYYFGNLMNLANLYGDMGRYELAESLFQEVKFGFEKQFGIEHPEYASVLYNLAILYRLMEQYESALSLHLEAMSIREKQFGKEHPQYTQSLSSLAILYLCMEEYDLAEPLLLEAVTIEANVLGKEHLKYSSSVNTLAFLYRKTGRYELAETFYLEDISISEKILGRENSQYVNSAIGLSSVFWQTNQFKKAHYYLTESANIQKSLLINASKYLTERELDEYVNTFIQNLYYSYSFEQNKPLSAPKASSESCFNNAIFYKGFLLNTSAQVKGLALSDSILAKKYELFQSFHRRLASEYIKPIGERKAVEELEEKANKIEKELVQSIKGFDAATQQVTWQQVQQQLQADELAIEFIHYPYYNPGQTDSTMYAALVLFPGDKIPAFIPLFEEEQLNNLLSSVDDNNEEFLDDLYSTRGVVPRKKKQQKGPYHLVWEPLDSFLEGVEKVYYSPSGILNKIAFNAIQLNDIYLSDKYALVQLSSTRNLVFKDSIENYSPTNAIVYGGIEYSMDSLSITVANNDFKKKDFIFKLNDYNVAERGNQEDSWQYLPGTKEELTKISSLFHVLDIPTTSLQDYKATEESFKTIGEDKPSPSILHIATHGFFFPDLKKDKENLDLGGSGFRFSENPLIRSGLIMAGANQAWQGKPIPDGIEDGILTAYEISNMNLSNTKLVVLSACETGLGDIKGSEGVFGLQRAFKMAGVENIIMSLWQVPDEQTGKLMEKFYSFWLNDNLTIREAFQNAQKEMRTEYQAPYYWAGFVLID